MPRSGIQWTTDCGILWIYFWDQRQHENSPVAFYQLNQKSQLDAQLVPLELLDGGDPITGRLVGQPVIVELPHLEVKYQFRSNI